eukprot:CCRYP_014936-RE/>CCRYP_014936-RE protein AED:0.01 eAED:0.01 QI:1895/1/1/1/0.28/0.12/8/13586/181
MYLAWFFVAFIFVSWMFFKRPYVICSGQARALWLDTQVTCGGSMFAVVTMRRLEAKRISSGAPTGQISSFKIPSRPGFCSAMPAAHDGLKAIEIDTGTEQISARYITRLQLSLLYVSLLRVNFHRCYVWFHHRQSTDSKLCTLFTPCFAPLRKKKWMVVFEATDEATLNAMGDESCSINPE